MVEQERKALHDRKSEPESGAVGWRGTIELLENIRQMDRLDTDTSIGNYHFHVLTSPTATDQDPARYGVAERVGDHVQENSLQEQRIGEDP